MTSSDVTNLFFQVTSSYTPYRPGAPVPGQRFFDPAPEPATQVSRLTPHASRLEPHFASRLALHASRPTPCASCLTPRASRLTQNEATTPIRATEGCLAQDNPQGPSLRASMETLSPFVRNMLSTPDLSTQVRACQHAVRRTNFCDPPTHNVAGSSEADASSRPIRPDSPLSVDSGEHDSDAGFLNDVISDSDNSDDGDTCRPVRANSGKGVAA